MEESNEYIWKECELYKILIIQMANGEIKMAHQKKRRLLKNGGNYIQKVKKPTVLEIQNLIRKQFTSGGNIR